MAASDPDSDNESTSDVVTDDLLPTTRMAPVVSQAGMVCLTLGSLLCLFSGTGLFFGVEVYIRLFIKIFWTGIGFVLIGALFLRIGS